MTLSTSARRARALLLAGCSLVLLGFPSSAGAHAYLETSSPGPESVLDAAPRALKLVYDEDVVPRYARVAVVTPGGQDVAGPPSVAGHVVVGWPKGHHGPVRRRPLAGAVNLDRWDQPATDLATGSPRA